MPGMIRWAPGRTAGELHRMQEEMDRWLGQLWNWGPEETSRAVWPRTDIFEDAEGLRFQFEVPGLDGKDVKVTLAENTLTVSGERKLENEDRRQNYHRIERSFGAFERSFTLPASLDTDKARAEYQNGVLAVFIPRSERAKPRSVAVKVETK